MLFKSGWRNHVSGAKVRGQHSDTRAENLGWGKWRTEMFRREVEEFEKLNEALGTRHQLRRSVADWKRNLPEDTVIAEDALQRRYTRNHNSPWPPSQKPFSSRTVS